MVRGTVLASLCLTLLLVHSAVAQVGNRTGFGFNAFGNSPAGMGNTGGFATGSGMANSTANSNNFGSNSVGRGAYGAVAPGAMQGIPGVSNYGGGYQSNIGAGTVGVGTGANMGMGQMMLPGMMNGMLPGVAPPGFTKDMFGYDVGVNSADSGYTDFGNAITAMGMGYGPMGYGGMGYGGMGYGTMGYGAMGYGAMGYNPAGFGFGGTGAIVPGVGYVAPADLAAIGAVNASQAPLPARTDAVQAGLNADRNADNAPAAGANTNANAGASRPRGMRRSFLNDNLPVATANAIRIQNRLHSIKSPNLKNVKVLIANRTAIVSGTVDTKEDEQLVLRMVGLEPGVLEVKSEVTINAAPQ